MDELVKIKEIVDPSEILLVLDSMTGQDAVNSGSVFNDLLGVTGVILTKMDGDARGGAALSMKNKTPSERKNPSIINGSRRKRIANGSGTSPSEINQLLNQFKQMQKMMRRLSKGKSQRSLMEMFNRK